MGDKSKSGNIPPLYTTTASEEQKSAQVHSFVTSDTVASSSATPASARKMNLHAYVTKTSEYFLYNRLLAAETMRVGFLSLKQSERVFVYPEHPAGHIRNHRERVYTLKNTSQ